MNDIKNMSRKLITICMFPLVLTACGGASEVSFSQDVKPILDQNCSQCHHAGGEGEVASGFNMATYDGVMKGAKTAAPENSTIMTRPKSASLFFNNCFST